MIFVVSIVWECSKWYSKKERIDFTDYRGERMNDFEERNQQIYAARMKGASLTSLGKEYSLSEERIRRICLKIEDKKNKKENKMFQFLFELSGDDILATRTCTVLKNSGIENKADIIKLKKADFKNMRNCGPKMEALIRLAIEKLEE